jgi:hypothetical protein
MAPNLGAQAEGQCWRDHKQHEGDQQHPIGLAQHLHLGGGNAAESHQHRGMNGHGWKQEQMEKGNADQKRARP